MLCGKWKSEIEEKGMRKKSALHEIFMGTQKGNSSQSEKRKGKK